MLPRLFVILASLLGTNAFAVGHFTGSVPDWAEGARTLAITLPIGENQREVLYVSGTINESGQFDIPQPSQALATAHLMALQDLFVPNLKARCRRYSGQIEISQPNARAISFGDIRVALPGTRAPSPGSVLAGPLWEENILFNSHISVPDDSDGNSTLLGDLRWIYVNQPVTLKGQTECTPAQTPDTQEITSVDLNLPAGWTAIVKRLTFADGILKSETKMAEPELNDAWEFGTRD